MPELSPAAFAVVDAFVCAHARKSDPSSNIDIAAALRAAVDQVLPLDDDPEFYPGNCCERVLKQEREETRDALLGIANSLEAQ